MTHTPIPTWRTVRPAQFQPAEAWAALPIATFDGRTTVRLHWTDQPYRWHVNDGEEVFCVVGGAVHMHVRGSDGLERIEHLEVGDVFHAAPGCEHVAHPVGAARVLVVEREGSE